MIPVTLEYKWLRWGLAVAVGVWIVAGVGWYCYRKGSAQAHAEDASRYAAELARANEVYREKEKAHVAEVANLRLEYARLDEKEKGADNVVVGQLGSGAKRLRVRAASCPAVPAPGTAPGRTDVPPTCELSPEVGARLYQLAADADSTARQLGALQDWAYSAVKLCNGGKP